MRAALDDLATHEPPGPARRGARRHARARPGRARATIARSAPTRPSAGVDVLVTVGPRAARDARTRSTARRYAVADARRGRRAAPRARRPRATSCSSRRSRGVGLEVVTEALRGARTLMGEVLIAGTASLLICIFLSPEVHRVPARARVRPAHPRGRAAGAPRQGGHADDGRDHHLHRVAVPFLLLTDCDCARDRRVRRRARVRAARLRRRLHEDRQAPLARACAGARSSSSRSLISIGLWLVATRGADLPDTRPPAHRRRHASTSATSIPVFIYLVLAGHDLGGEPHRRARRPRRGLRRDRAARLHRDHVHDRPDRPRAGRRLPGRRAASASSGSTRSRRRSSWATPARSGSAARSRRSR